jgi:phage terminase small subunit
MPRVRVLRDKQKKFVEEYLVDLNATQAAIRAGYSVRRAAEIGWQLLQKSPVQEAIQAEREKQSERTKITADWVLTRLREEATPGAEETGFSPSRVKALELLGKHLALFTDKLQTEQRIVVIELDNDSLPD